MTNPPRFRLLVAFVLVLPFALLLASARAWGPDGHRIVADIATAHLTPRAKALVGDLLDGKSLDEVANWPDEARREHPEWAHWHFVDIPFDARSFDENRDGDKGNNVIDQIGHFAKVLHDSHASRADRATAIKFVVHFVGDVHQPLHCIDRNDRGGNTRLVFLLDASRAINLHSAWDSAILKRLLNGTSDPVFASALDARVSKADAAKWASGSPEAWATETHDIAVKDVYHNIPTDGPPPKLTEDYVATAEADTKAQLTKAGIRLAYTLNRAAE